MSAQEVIANPLHAFALNRDKAMLIRGNLLESFVTHGSDTYGDYTSMVTARLGEVTIKSRFLRIQRVAQGRPADVRIGGGNEIFGYADKIEAVNDVVVTYGDQSAVGERLILDMRTGMATLTGDVVVWLGPHVMRGGRLITHLSTGASRIDGPRAPLGDRVPLNPALAAQADIRP